MRYLVTGAAGFIGSHILEHLLKEGHSVVILDNFSSGKEENLSFCKNYPLKSNRWTLIKGDIRDYQTCLKACKDVDAIFHQAALRSVPKSMLNPYEYNQVNIDGTLNMLNAAKESKVKRFVFASSSSIYGETKQFPEKEDFYPLLISPYALTKLAGEFYCRIFSKEHCLETVCLRYFNVFGPAQALDDEYAVVIPKFIHCVLGDEQPPIFGSGRQSRDFTYIDDVVQANILAATAANIKYDIFNVATGEDHTVLELVHVLNKIMAKSIEPKFLPPRAGDVFKTCASISKIKKILKYEPCISFEDGLKKTVEYFRSKPRTSY